MSRPARSRIDALAVTMPDLAASRRFFCDALAFTPAGEPHVHAAADAALLGLPRGTRMTSQRLALGRQHLVLMAMDPPGRPYPPGSTATDLWFQHAAIVVADMGAAYGHLRTHPIAPITVGGPQVLPPDTGSVAAFKFRAPSGHPFELLHLPPGTGDPAWQADGPLFRGMDHTAIAVSSATRSARFYGEALGFAVSARSANRGAAQSRLDDVAADRVEVVALEPGQPTPHLELLGYDAGPRRPFPQGGSLADAAGTLTILAGIEGPLVFEGAPWPAAEGFWQGASARLLRDPDGHALLLLQD